ncbi:hypothetical protein [Streptomyces sp. bgisy159]|uniref:hypothetical protein n=1 Tax=Streptomyces sp. bgisy159 TaxID=3413795 RepID=UPI003F49FA03
MNDPQLCDTVIDGDRQYRIVAFSEDDGAKLNDGRWVCASKFVPVTRACWRYEPGGTTATSARGTLVTTLTNLLAVSRRGRMDAHRAEAERLVDEVLKEYAHALADKLRDEAWPHERDERENELIYKLADLIDPEAT